MRSLYLLHSYGTAGLDGEQLVVRCAGEEIERVRLPLLVDPFNVWLIRIRRIRADQGFEARDGGIFLDEATRRLWLKTWSTYMAERVTLADGRQGQRWELVDGLVRAFVRFVYAPVDGLVVPQRR